MLLPEAVELELLTLPSGERLFFRLVVALSTAASFVSKKSLNCIELGAFGIQAAPTGALLQLKVSCGYWALEAG